MSTAAQLAGVLEELAHRNPRAAEKVALAVVEALSLSVAGEAPTSPVEGPTAHRAATTTAPVAALRTHYTG